MQGSRQPRRRGELPNEIGEQNSSGHLPLATRRPRPNTDSRRRTSNRPDRTPQACRIRQFPWNERTGITFTTAARSRPASRQVRWRWRRGRREQPAGGADRDSKTRPERDHVRLAGETSERQSIGQGRRNRNRVCLWETQEKRGGVLACVAQHRQADFPRAEHFLIGTCRTRRIDDPQSRWKPAGCVRLAVRSHLVAAGGGRPHNGEPFCGFCERVAREACLE